MQRVSPKKIGLVLASVPPYSETFFYTKINGLTRSGADIFLFAPGKTNPELDCTHVKPYPVYKYTLSRVFCAVLIVPVLFLRIPHTVVRFWKFEREDGRGVLEIFRALYLNAHLLTRRLDWLHFGFATTALGRENVARAIGAKMGVSFRGFDINVYPLKNPGCYLTLWKRVDRVHSISEYLLQGAYQLGLGRETPWTIITPAVSAPPNPKTDFVLHTPVRILTVARLTWIKGLTYGIESMAILKARGLRIQYTLVGDGAEHDKLMAQTEALGLKNEIIFAGKLPHRETLIQMHDCDVYIQPSLNEGFCNAVLEAQAVGCLCIASDAGALPENILHNETGWLVPPQNADALANAIAKTLQLSAAERRQVSNRASARVAANFTVEAHLKAWKEFYK